MPSFFLTPRKNALEDTPPLNALFILLGILFLRDYSIAHLSISWLIIEIDRAPMPITLPARLAVYA